jgi:hypothetical protein
MNIAKRYWFSAAVLLVGVIGFNLVTIYNRRPGNGGVDTPPEGRVDRRPVETAAQAGPGIPRTLSLAVAPRNDGAKLDPEALVKGLESMGAVQRVQPGGDNPMTLELTIVEPVKISVVSERLANLGAVVVADRSPLRGDLRLHLSGLT